MVQILCSDGGIIRNAQMITAISRTTGIPQGRVATYLTYFFFTLHAVIPLYINSNFLTSITTERINSLTFTVAAVITIAAIAASSRAIRSFGNYRTVLTLMLIDIVALVILSAGSAIVLLLFAFITHWIMTAGIRFHLDIFLEENSEQAKTDQIRGTLSALNHVAYLFGPLIAGFLLGENTFWLMYLASAVLAVPAVVLLVREFRDFNDPAYHYHNIRDSLKTAWADYNVRWVLICMFVLRLFFAWMVVYTPLYLKQYVGLPFDQIGIIFSIMLLPYVLFGRWLGEIADQWLGEKELLIAGFVIAAGFTASLAFVNSTAVIVWGLLLFGTRVGATMVQVMSDGFFFKHIGTADANELSLRRMIKPAAYIIAPALATVMVAVGPFSSIFLWVAGVMIFGAFAATPIADTR